MIHVTCRLTAKNRDELRNPTLGNRVWAAFTFYTAGEGLGVQAPVSPLSSMHELTDTKTQMPTEKPFVFNKHTTRSNRCLLYSGLLFTLYRFILLLRLLTFNSVSLRMGSPLVLAGVASTGTVGALRLHYPPLAPQKSRRNNGGQ